jgi:predicted TIM-barrel fold metal-dependent hydrolase
MLKFLGGAPRYSPQQLLESSRETKELLAESFQGLDRKNLLDIHVHIVGLDSEQTGCYLNPKMRSWRHPLQKVITSLLMLGSGLNKKKQIDNVYIDNLLAFNQGFELVPGYDEIRQLLFMFAFDEYYSERGAVETKYSPFYVPNDYCFKVCCQYPKYFVPVFSVHPYREDALDELSRCAELFTSWEEKASSHLDRKVPKLIKWLPNSMGMNPSAKRCIPFYRKMIELGFVLLSHSGLEQAVLVKKGNQSLGNPNLLQPALDEGLKVIFAHSGGVSKSAYRWNHNIDLVIKILKTPRYRGLAFADISAMTLFNQMGSHEKIPLKLLLEDSSLHQQLLNGSDYPLPCNNFSIPLRSVVKRKLIDKDLVPYLREIYHYNPLLFDFVLKRCLRHPETKQKFSPQVFELPTQLHL